MIKIFKIESDNNIRLDRYLRNKYTSLTQSFIEKNIRKKNILINNHKTSSNYLIKEKDEIKILNFHKDIYKCRIVFKKSIKVSNQTYNKFKRSVLYENDDFLILNKWSSISSQGGSKISESIDHIIKNISKDYRLVHRLDKETSGLLIIAKNLNFAKIFGNLFKLGSIKKTYFALCEGIPKLKHSIVSLDLKNKFNKIQKTETYYKLLYERKGISVVMFQPKTGKTHQIRRVCKNLSIPIIGDTKYNYQSKFKTENLKLNAFKLEFTIKSKVYKFYSKLPSDFTLFMKTKNLKNINSYFLD